MKQTTSINGESQVMETGDFQTEIVRIGGKSALDGCYEHSFGSLPDKTRITDPWAYRFFPSELFIFCMGVMSFKSVALIKDRINIKKYYKYFILLIIVTTLSYSSIDVSSIFKLPAYLLAVAIALPFIFEGLKKNKLDREIGEVSYPVYLCHLIVIDIIYYFDISIFGDQSLVIVAGSIVMATAITYLVSKPIEKKFKIIKYPTAAISR